MRAILAHLIPHDYPSSNFLRGILNEYSQIVSAVLHHAYSPYLCRTHSHVLFTPNRTPPLSLLSQDPAGPSIPRSPLHSRPPFRSAGLQPDHPPPHHGVRHEVPGSLALNQYGADLAVRPHQASCALTPRSTRSRDEGAVLFILLG
ncbi:hypothetical protein ACQJBY_038565 [Aegilops geniculata]